MADHEVTAEQFTNILRACGHSEESMEQFHREFEKQHPSGHQAFLEWLGMTAQDAAIVRQKFS